LTKQYVVVTVKKKLITQKRKIMDLNRKGSLMKLGMSYISVPFENASKKNYETMKKRRDADAVFKEWIQLRYNAKKRLITVSCIFKRKTEVLDKFIGNSNYP
jgi:hypothetical protein